MLQDAALASAAADIQAAQEAERPVCPECGGEAEGTRQCGELTTQHNQTLELSAVMGSARSAEQAFFPLDDELELLAGTLTPSLQEDLVRLGAWMPFERAAQELQRFRLVDVSRPTVERTDRSGGAPMWPIQNG